MSIFKLMFLVFFVQILLFGQNMGNKPILLPVDESNIDESFKVFKEELKLAIENKNLNFVLKSLDKEVFNSFGGNEGIEGFKEYWQINNNETDLWEIIDEVISLGGSFSEDEEVKIFTAPYVTSNWPIEFDEFEYVAVIDSNVSLRELPDTLSTEVKKLNYEILKYDNSYYEDKNWLKVETDKGEIGFTLSTKVRSPIDYRIGFQKKEGDWKIIWFVSGD